MPEGATAHLITDVRARPGELLDQAVVDYLRTGASGGMLIPDAAAGTLGTVRVSVHNVGAD
ncbi:hypothetical protein [Streptomyces atroolivaceus]|uniref:hypothetical protein n=1 Tax=Streptomyces atroolivaceus TaxID=66869 RepID=UPI0036340422